MNSYIAYVIYNFLQEIVNVLLHCQKKKKEENILSLHFLQSWFESRSFKPRISSQMVAIN